MSDRTSGGTRVAGVYSRDDRLFIYPYSRTTAGVLIGSKPVAVLARASGDDDLGQAVVSALDNFKSGLRHPSIEEFDGLQDPILEAAGVKSLATFATGACACEVSEDRGVLTITPSRKGRRKGTFLSVPERAVRINVSSGAGSVGAAVRSALSQCD